MANLEIILQVFLSSNEKMSRVASVVTFSFLVLGIVFLLGGVTLIVGGFYHTWFSSPYGYTDTGIIMWRMQTILGAVTIGAGIASILTSVFLRRP